MSFLLLYFRLAQVNVLRVIPLLSLHVTDVLTVAVFLKHYFDIFPISQYLQQFISTISIVFTCLNHQMEIRSLLLNVTHFAALEIVQVKKTKLQIVLCESGFKKLQTVGFNYVTVIIANLNLKL